MTDNDLNDLFRLAARRRRRELLRPLTPEEAQAAWEAAEPVQMSEDDVRRIVDEVTRRTEEES